jgi:hypothetical protein
VHLADRPLGIARAEPDVGAERDLQAAAEGVAVHGGDHRDRQLLPHPADLLAEVGEARLGEPADVGGGPRAGSFAAGHLAEHREVESGAERGTRSRQHHHPHALLCLESCAGLGDRRELLVVERVALVGTVEANVGDTVGDGDDHTVRHPASVAGTPWQARLATLIARATMLPGTDGEARDSLESCRADQRLGCFVR